MRKFIISILLLVTHIVSAQELNCHFQLNTDKIEGTNKDVFNTLSADLTDFMNSTKWTDAVFSDAEKIDCSFQIVIESVSGDTYSGYITVVASRPVYNSSYTTTLFSFKDENFKFTYAQYDKLEFNDNEFQSNLMSVLGFYVNIILGINFDSFARYGGTKYFEKAEMIAALARSSASDDAGWKAFDSDRNRYALITGFLDSNLKQMRDIVYEYHRLGLDEMASSVEKGKAKIYEGVPYLREMNRNKPYSVVLQLFIEYKVNELIDMFSNSTAKERKEVYDMILSIQPTYNQKAAPLLEGKN